MPDPLAMNATQARALIAAASIAGLLAAITFALVSDLWPADGSFVVGSMAGWVLGWTTRGAFDRLR